MPQAPPAPRPRRVAMVIQKFRPSFSGQGVQLEQLCRALSRRGVAATIITPVRSQPSETEEAEGYRIRRLRVDPPGLPFVASSTRWWAPLFALRTFAYLVRHRRDFDVVHVHALTDALYAAWMFCRSFALPIVFEMTLLGTDDPATARRGGHFLPGVRWSIYRRCDAYVAISPALADSYRAVGLPAPRLRTIPQGVDPERFRPAEDRTALRLELDLPPEAPLLVFVGSLIRRKGIDVLLGAWPRVLEAVPPAHLLLVGKRRFDDDPAAAAFLEDRLADLPAAARQRVRLVGETDAVERWLAAADVFVFPTRREGFGSAIIEAMACGLPSVVAALPGITDLIFSGDGTDGIVVPQEDSRRLADEVAGILRDPERAAAIGAAARRRAVDEFGIDRIAESYLRLYADLLLAGRPR